jgi:hypothetical protein
VKKRAWLTTLSNTHVCVVCPQDEGWKRGYTFRVLGCENTYTCARSMKEHLCTTGEWKHADVLTEFVIRISGAETNAANF